ncbi:hypothetical protein AAV94_07650 [Lampropedia cohaerens]|uniref:Uncharacterized protein n=1 Tax=Lampropedia cohaerens TaxID=1610491 RepID=A0A0U1PZS9_9BURK|nr:hypothetical protein [Lampropedia cohaerens]KKW68022.1 hypothetical protein AAV94_07650 [Lampropedia cohaerens]
MSHHRPHAHAIALADHFVATILEEDPELLVSSLDGLEDEEIRQVARRLATFRLALVEALSLQPLDADDDDELDGDDD